MPKKNQTNAQAVAAFKAAEEKRERKRKWAAETDHRSGDNQRTYDLKKGPYVGRSTTRKVGVARKAR